MMQTRYDDDLLRRYLLGAADAGESASLDELCLTDDDCALALASVENDLVDAYARGGLTGAERVRFERHYLASPLRREKTHFAQALQRLGDRVAAPSASGRGEVLPRQPTPFAWFGFSPVWQGGLAVTALVLMAASIWLGMENRRLRREAVAEHTALIQRVAELEAGRNTADSDRMELLRLRERLAGLKTDTGTRGEAGPSATAAAPAVQLFAFTLAAPVRGTNALARIDMPIGAATAAVRLELESNDHRRYRAALRDPLTGRIVWRSGDLTAVGSGAGRAVAVRVPARLFAAQRYAFELSGVSAQGAEERLGSYPFEIVKP